VPEVFFGCDDEGRGFFVGEWAQADEVFGAVRFELDAFGLDQGDEVDLGFDALYLGVRDAAWHGVLLWVGLCEA
jgi:hypothetical protein